MTETSVPVGSETQVLPPAQEKEVQFDSSSKESVVTTCDAVTGLTFPVRATRTKQEVVVNVDIERLRKQREIAEANETIRRLSRG